MPGNPFTDPNWAPELADTVERVVGGVRDKATLKAVTLVRAIVFGIVVSVAAIVALVLVVILATKLLQRVINIDDFIEEDSAVGLSYVVVGAVLVAAGFLAMGRRTAKDAR